MTSQPTEREGARLQGIQVAFAVPDGWQLPITASGPGFTANISLKTQGNKQSVTIRSEGAFRSVSISLSRG